MDINGKNIRVIYSRRRSISLEVSARDGVKVRAPKGVSEQELARFLAAREAWLTKALAKMEARQARLPVYPESEAAVAALKAQARAYIPARVEHYAHILGVQPTKVGFTRAKTRFGSCSGKDAIHFSCYLMLFSKQAVDYVVVHELCHIRHKNHSREFYAMIESVMPDYKQREKELKGYDITENE